MKNNLIQIVLTVFLVGGAFAVGSLWTELKLLKGGQVKQAAPPSALPKDQEEKPLADELWQEALVDPAYTQGDQEAPVVMVEFSDYQCPFCKRHFDQTSKQIETEYIKTGKVRWIVRDLPLSFHQNAHAAAQAARCAGDQNQYRQMHDKLFETQTAWAENSDAGALFSGYAGAMGLNRATFDQCLSSEKYQAAVDNDLSLAAKAGANGTPTFFINGKVLVGAQPFSVFKSAIDAEL